MSNKEYKKIENKGWKEMQQMLDQEMPAEQPKRRIVPWFWLSGIAVVFAVIAVFVGLDFAPTSIESVATNGSNTPQIVENTAIETVEISAVGQNDISTEKEVSNEKLVPSPKVEIPNIEIINPAKIVRTKITKPTTQTITNKIDQEVLSKYEAFKLENLSETCNPPSLVPYIPTTFANLEKLPIGNAELVYEKSQKPELNTVSTKTIKPIKESKNKAQWVMNTGILSTTQPRFHGGSASLKVEIPISKKWNLQSGLTYRMVKLEAILANEGVAQGNFVWGTQHNGMGIDSVPGGASAFDLGEATYNVQTENYEVEFTNRYHFVAIPIEAHFQIKKSHRIWGGVETSYLLNRDQSNDDFDNFNSIRDNSAPALSLDAFSNPPIPRIDLAVSVGYQYQISNKIGASISYHHGNLIQKNRWRLNNKFFKLGANYRL